MVGAGRVRQWASGWASPASASDRSRNRRLTGPGSDLPWNDSSPSADATGVRLALWLLPWVAIFVGAGFAGYMSLDRHPAIGVGVLLACWGSYALGRRR